MPSETREKRVSDWLQENPHEDGDSQLRVEYVLFIQLIFFTFFVESFWLLTLEVFIVCRIIVFFFPSMDLRIWEIDKFVIRKVGCVCCLSYLGFEIVGSSRYQGQEIFQFKFTVLFVNNIITRNHFL